MTEYTTSKSKEKGNKNPRELVLEMLIKIFEEGQYCHTVIRQTLSEYSELGKRDRAFVTRLCRGTVERCLTLDFEIEKYASLKIKKMKPLIRNLLRMSVYQIGYFSQTPPSAVCNEAVNIVKKRKIYGLTGFVNGILRQIVQHKDEFAKLPEKMPLSQQISIQYSIPEWIIKEWLIRFKKETTIAMCKAFLEDSPLTIRVNESKKSILELKEELITQEVTVKRAHLFPDAFYLEGVDRLSQLKSFSIGAFQVQDESSMCIARVAGICAGDVILDVCAAPGGKALHAAELLCQKADGKKEIGKVIARDISKEKTALILENLQRTKYSNITVQIKDATVFYPEYEALADIVFADLPCSGLGILGRKPDIRYKTTKELRERLAKLQREILTVICRYVKPKGVLIYSTCTISEEENEQNYSFLISELGFEAESLDDYLPSILHSTTTKKGYLQLLPGVHQTDGFFLAKVRKKG